MKPLPMIAPDPVPTPEPTPSTPVVADPQKTETLRPAIVQAISTVFDPEIPVNIWELGLIYDIAVDASNAAVITMTLTAPGCPAAQSLPSEVAAKVKAVPGISDAIVDVVWEPGWTKDRMSEAAKLQLGMW
jgi:FeS assembly SUF system protein